MRNCVFVYFLCALHINKTHLAIKLQMWCKTNQELSQSFFFALELYRWEQTQKWGNPKMATRKRKP